MLQVLHATVEYDSTISAPSTYLQWTPYNAATWSTCCAWPTTRPAHNFLCELTAGSAYFVNLPSLGLFYSLWYCLNSTLWVIELCLRTFSLHPIYILSRGSVRPRGHNSKRVNPIYCTLACTLSSIVIHLHNNMSTCLYNSPTLHVRICSSHMLITLLLTHGSLRSLESFEWARPPMIHQFHRRARFTKRALQRTTSPNAFTTHLHVMGAHPLDTYAHRAHLNAWLCYTTHQRCMLAKAKTTCSLHFSVAHAWVG